MSRILQGLSAALVLAVVMGLGSTSVKANFLTAGNTLSFGQILYSSNAQSYLFHNCDELGVDTYCFIEWSRSGACGHSFWLSFWDGDCSSLGNHSDQVGAGDTGNFLQMQTDGNLVLYNGSSSAIWATDTNGYGSSTYLNAQDDGNLVLYYNTNVAIWAIY